MSGRYNRLMKTSDVLDSASPTSSSEDDDKIPQPGPQPTRSVTRRNRNTSNRTVRYATTKVPGARRGPTKRLVKTSASPSSSSEDNVITQSSSDEFHPSSDDLQSSSSSDDFTPSSSSDESKPSSDSDSKSPNSSDNPKSSSDDNVIPKAKSVPRATSHLAFRSANATNPTPSAPYKRPRKTSAVLPDTTSSDDDSIPITKPRRGTSSSGDTGSSNRFPKAKTAVAVKHTPSVPMKRSLQVSVSPVVVGGPPPPYPPRKIAKISPVTIPNPSNNQMNNSFIYANQTLTMPTSSMTIAPPVPPLLALPPPLVLKPYRPIFVQLQRSSSTTPSSSSMYSHLPPTATTSRSINPVSLISAKILKEISPTDFTDEFLHSGDFQAKLLAPVDSSFALISEYITNSQAHPGFIVNLQHVLEINRLSENPPPSNSSDPPKFTMMLWHGTKPQYVSAILKNGFRCPATGNQMFGQGVYFADRVSKSGQYCGQLTGVRPRHGEVGYLFLCEVVIGKSYNARLAKQTYKAVPTATRRNGSVMTFDSVMCTGGSVPDRSLQKEIDGVTWPLGPTVTNTKFQNYTVLYNEYIVYDPERIKIRFLVKVVFG